MAASAVEATPGNPLNALADVAANLFISLPDSPKGTPFIDRAEAGSPAALLRAMRRRLNLTQREFGILLSPNGASPISPSVICQLESALQTVPPQLVSRAVAATTAAQRLGEYLSKLASSKSMDAAGALKVLGPGCIEELQPYLDASPELTAEEASLVREFLSIVTKRRHSTGGSRPGARGPYRKLSKLSEKGAKPNSENSETGDPEPSTPNTARAQSGTPEPSASGGEQTPTPVLPEGSSPRPLVSRFSPRVPDTGLECSSGRSTPCSSACSTPGSSRGSSRPRSPTSATGYESLNSPALTPGGTVAGLTPAATGSGAGGSREVSLEVLMALRRLQEENESLQQENKRLRAMVPDVPVASAPAEVLAAPEAVRVPETPVTSLVEAPSELSRVDVGMSC